METLAEYLDRTDADYASWENAESSRKDLVIEQIAEHSNDDMLELLYHIDGGDLVRQLVLCIFRPAQGPALATVCQAIAKQVFDKVDELHGDDLVEETAYDRRN